MIEQENEMPTELRRRDPEMPLMIVRRSSYLEVLKKYHELMHISDSMEDLIGEMEKTIDFYERELDEQLSESDTSQLQTNQESTSDYESGVLKVRFTPEKGVEVVKPKKRKKFAGATIEFDPIKRSLGLGLHFKEVSD